MLEKPQSCKNCALYGNGKGFIIPDGLGINGISIIGDMGYQTDTNIGKPFAKLSAGGLKLQQVFNILQSPRPHFKLGNIISCSPRLGKLQHMPYEMEAIHNCSKYLNLQLPKGVENYILALGPVAARELTGFSGEGKQTLANTRGFLVKSKYGYVISSYHPDLIKRSKPQFIEYLLRDLQALLKAKINGIPKIPDYRFIINPTYDDIKSFYFLCKSSPNLPISYDIETDQTLDTEEDERQGLEHRNITQIQFSLGKDLAIVFKWEERFRKIVQLFFLLENIKLGFNIFNFDDPRLRGLGFRLERGKFIDLMWMFKHHKPGLERGLQKVASFIGYPEEWKSRSLLDPDSYGCHDVNAPQYIFPYLVEQMTKEGTLGTFWSNETISIDSKTTEVNHSSLSIAKSLDRGFHYTPVLGNVPDGYLGHVADFWPKILDPAKEIGLSINLEKMNNLESDLKLEVIRLNREIQLLVPDEVKNIHPKRKDKKTKEITYGYAKPPKKLLSSLLEAYLQAPDGASKNISFNSYCQIKEGLRSRLVSTESGQINQIWWRQLEFKASKQQIEKYITAKKLLLSKSKNTFDQNLAKYYVMPKVLDAKTREMKTSTGAKALANLLEKTSDPVIKRIIGDPKADDFSIGDAAGIRSIQKIIKNDIKNWQPASDGAVHTTWGMKAASGQLDARNPNILNASKHTKVGNIFRSLIEAPDDDIYVECDKKSYHVATMGFVANSANYIKFSQTDPHSFFTAYVAKGELGLPTFDMGAEEIMEICSRYKKHEKWSWVRQHVSKVIVLGNQLGLGSRKAYLQNRKSFDSEIQVKRLQNKLASIFPEVEDAKRNIKELAYKNKMLVNEWGYKQDLWEVFRWQFDKETARVVRVPGTEAEKALAFPVQSLAFGDIRDKLIQLKQKGLLEIYKFVVSIHDSFGFRFKRSLLDNFVSDVMPILESPSRRLIKSCCPEGLIVGVELAWGKNWGKYQQEKNPEGMRELKIDKKKGLVAA